MTGLRQRSMLPNESCRSRISRRNFSRARRERSLLAPAGHAAVDELPIAGKKNVGTEPKALHHAGAEAFDQRVGRRNQAQRRIDTGRLLQIDRNRALAAVEQRKAAGVEERNVARVCIRDFAVDDEHAGAEVRENHSAEWPRADAGELDNADALQRTHANP